MILIRAVQLPPMQPQLNAIDLITTLSQFSAVIAPEAKN
ncbi:MAG: hypothetical protein EZS28_049883, partial [Streblomastix strix]